MQITENNQEIENIHYISTANMEIRNNQHVIYITLGDLPIATYHSNSNELNYLHLDNLGSVIGITDEAGDILTRYNYDAWGRLRNPQDLTFLENSPLNNQIFRGYTFHEHIEYFNIINMNGRMYDPVTARFFSPDPLLQDPTNTQNLNRYTYVLNNPLKYTDPSGYAYQGFGNSQLNGVSTTLLNSSSQISQQVQDMETRRKGFVNNLWQDVTLFDLIGFYGDGDGGNDEPIPKKKQVNEQKTAEVQKWYSIYNWPALGSSAKTMDAIYAGDYLSAAAHFLTCGVEVFTFGSASGITWGTRSASTVAKSGISEFEALVQQLPKTGQQNVRILKNWAKSKGYVKSTNTSGPQVWGVYDDVGNFSWRLKIKAEGSMQTGLEAGSQVPRFDARLSPGKYINPFNGKIGGKSIGTHIPLF